MIATTEFVVPRSMPMMRSAMTGPFSAPCVSVFRAVRCRADSARLVRAEPARVSAVRRRGPLQGGGTRGGEAVLLDLSVEGSRADAQEPGRALPVPPDVL